MIKALYVERQSCKMVYAEDIKTAVEAFRAAGLEVEAVKEVGADEWKELKK